MYIYENLNPTKRRVGDCVVRAITKATGDTWKETYLNLCLKGLEMGDMPSSNAVWGAYLSDRGFKRGIIPNNCPECYTVGDFAKEHPTGIYVVALGNHAVAVVDGDIYDTWDSTEEIPIYFWRRNDV